MRDAFCCMDVYVSCKQNDFVVWDQRSWSTPTGESSESSVQKLIIPINSQMATVSMVIWNSEDAECI